MTIHNLPHLNATLNATSTALLLAGFVCIKTARIRAHATLMISAAVTSAAFLVCYLIYHHYAGEVSTTLMTWLPRWLRYLYLVILIPHLLLAIGMLPMIALTFWRAYHRDWPRHRRIAPPTFFIWLYVSATGVLIYWMLYHLFPKMKG